MLSDAPPSALHPSISLFGLGHNPDFLCYHDLLTPQRNTCHHASLQSKGSGSLNSGVFKNLIVVSSMLNVLLILIRKQ